jgi:hypothetical protein
VRNIDYKIIVIVSLFIRLTFCENSSQNAEEIGVSKPWKQNPLVELSLAFVTRRSNYESVIKQSDNEAY